MEAKYCPFCKESLEQLTDRTYRCEKCEVLVQIHIVIVKLHPPLLKRRCTHAR